MLFIAANLEWVPLPPGSFGNMLIISFRGLGKSVKGRFGILHVWQERNVRIFEKRCKMEKVLWDIIHFYASLWASYTLYGILFNSILLSWLSICN